MDRRGQLGHRPAPAGVLVEEPQRRADAVVCKRGQPATDRTIARLDGRPQRLDEDDLAQTLGDDRRAEARGRSLVREQVEAGAQRRAAFLVGADDEQRWTSSASSGSARWPPALTFMPAASLVVASVHASGALPGQFVPGFAAALETCSGFAALSLLAAVLVVPGRSLPRRARSVGCGYSTR